jgi:hypothetical protein
VDNAELVAVLSQTEQNSLALLLQAVNSCQQDMINGVPGAGARLIKAQEHLEKFKRLQAAGSASSEASSESLGKLPAVLAYLKAQGWKLEKSTLYNAKRRGQLKVQPDGTVTKADADAYAAASLKPADAAPDREDGEVLRMKRDLVQAELELKQQATERSRMRLEKERGALIPRDDVDALLVAAVSALRSSMRQWIYVKMGEFVELVSGDPRRVEEGIHFFLAESNGFFNGFSRARTFDVVDDEDELETEADPGAPAA